MKRKTFIVSIIGALGLSGFFTWLLFRDRSAYAIPEVLSGLTTDREIKQIGALYLHRYPEEQNEQKLLYHLGLLSDVRSGSKKINRTNVEEFLSERIEADFLQDRICVIQGWVLARTEARQCALFYLSKL
jgi:hypothetical protein